MAGRAKMRRDVPLGGPRRPGSPSVYEPSPDRRPTAASGRPARTDTLRDLAGGPFRVGGPRPISPAGEPRITAFTHRPGRGHLRPLGLPAPVRAAHVRRPDLGGPRGCGDRHYSPAPSVV